ncbi:hypothetical protein CsSME_00012944 [Camellia sinensis var. sinensis]
MHNINLFIFELSTKTICEPSGLQRVNNRTEVRRQSFMEMQIFKKRWNNAVKDDKCWVNPYQQPIEQKSR